MTTPGPDVSARLAWPADSEAIARCQLNAWQAAYVDLVDAKTLAAFDESQISAVWAEALSRPKDARSRVLVALERADVRGFALVHPSQDPDSNSIDDAEIAEFAIDPPYRRGGHGSRLLQASADTMRADGFTRALWWIGSTDDALRAFVTGTGWEADGAHRELETDTGARFKQVRLHSDLTTS